MTEYKIVGAVDDARRCAAVLGLIDERPDGIELTPLGQEVVRFVTSRYRSIKAGLEKFENWYRKSRQFSDLAPEWGQLARRVVFAYPVTQLLVEELRQMYDDWIREPTLVELVERLYTQHPSFTVELFIRGRSDVRSQVLTTDGELRQAALRDGNVYIRRQPSN